MTRDAEAREPDATVHPLRLSVGPSYLLELLQAETWTDYLGRTERIADLDADHAWNILSHTLRHADEIVALARRLFPKDRHRRGAATRRDADRVVALLSDLEPVAWVRATPAWHAIVLHLVALGELDDPAHVVERVLGRAIARGLAWEIGELRAALGQQSEAHLGSPEGAEGSNYAESAMTEPELRSLIAEVYGAEVDRFLATPRRSLGGRTAEQALRDGDIQEVWEAAATDLLGHWA